MNVTVYPGALSGRVTVPASKSAAHRLLICAALADRPTRVILGALNEDIEATAACLRALGARIDREDDALAVAPIKAPPSRATLECGESGSTLRFLLPVAAALGVNATFTGRGRLPQRPNKPLTDALRAHGATLDNDLLPLTLFGPIRGGDWTLPGNVSSQYVSGLLFALPLLAEDSALTLSTPLESAPYVAMTLESLARFNVTAKPIEHGWQIRGGQRFHSPGEIAVEGDWSAAAFWLAANALGSRIRVEGLDSGSAQGDRAVTRLIGQSEIDVSAVPDLTPPLAIAATASSGRTSFTGGARLRLKESDRLESVAGLLNALGRRTITTDDGLVVEAGDSQPCDADVRVVDGAGDHRIVMAAAVAATAADRPVRILGAEAVRKSYPDFFKDFEALGGKLHVEHIGQ